MRAIVLSMLASVGMVVGGCHGAQSCCDADTPGAGAYRHVVLFKFKDTATKEQVTAIVEAFGKLSTQVDTIRGYEWGTDVSPEGKADGFTHCFVVTFDDRAGLDKYLPSQAHQDFIKVLRPSLDKVLVVDFVAKK